MASATLFDPCLTMAFDCDQCFQTSISCKWCAASGDVASNGACVASNNSCPQQLRTMIPQREFCSALTQIAKSTTLSPSPMTLVSSTVQTSTLKTTTKKPVSVYTLFGTSTTTSDHTTTTTTTTTTTSTSSTFVSILYCCKEHLFVKTVIKSGGGEHRRRKRYFDRHVWNHRRRCRMFIIVRYCCTICMVFNEIQ
jgi:hypothetical protein